MNKATFSSESKATAVTATSNSNQKKIPLPPTYKEQIQEGVPFGKRKFYGREGQTYAQFSVGLSMFIAFIATPFLGKKLATDEEFRKLVPSWYFDSYRMKVPERDPNTRQSLHNQLIAMQKDLHERAIRGEFTKENRDKMVFKDDLKDDPYGWSKIHPGVDEDDEDDEDEDEN